MLIVLSFIFFFFMLLDSIYENRAPVAKTRGVSRLNTRLSFYAYELRKLQYYRRKAQHLTRYSTSRRGGLTGVYALNLAAELPASEYVFDACFNMGRDVARILSLFQFALQRGALRVRVPHTAATRQLVAAFVRIGFLQGFIAVTAGPTSENRRNHGLICYLRYVDRSPAFVALRSYCTFRRKLSLPLNGLHQSSAVRTRQFCLFSTPFGFLTGAECLRRRCGGMLLCALFAVICVFLPAIRWWRNVVSFYIKIFTPTNYHWGSIFVHIAAARAIPRVRLRVDLNSIGDRPV